MSERAPEETVIVVCTDRGQHEPVVLDVLALWAGEITEKGSGPFSLGRLVSGGRGLHRTHRPRRAVRVEGTEPHLRLRCPRCSRDVDLRWSTASRMVQLAVESGVSRLDLSLR